MCLYDGVRRPCIELFAYKVLCNLDLIRPHNFCQRSNYGSHFTDWELKVKSVLSKAPNENMEFERHIFPHQLKDQVLKD